MPKMKNENIYCTDYDLILATVQPRPAPSSPVQPCLGELISPPICVHCAPECEIEALARVLADLHALGTDEVAQGARKLVRMLSPCQLYYLKALLLDSLPTVCVCVVCCDRCLLLKPCLSSSNGSKTICWDIPK
jgi:hypothetical protein